LNLTSKSTISSSNKPITSDKANYRGLINSSSNHKLSYDSRNQRGSILTYVLFLALTLAVGFSLVFNLTFNNTEFSSQTFDKRQAQALAESANNRALALMNTRTFADGAFEDEDDFEDDDDFWDDDFDDEDGDFDDEDFDDEDFDDEDDEDFWDDEEEEDTSSILKDQPRYINYNWEDVFYINIQSGAIVDENTYQQLLAEDKAKRSVNAEEFRSIPPVKELYLALPEVNVAKIGVISVPKAQQLKPGFTVMVADKATVTFKEDSIISEYLGIPDFDNNPENEPILRSISPNYMYPDEYLDLEIDGENLEEQLIKFSSKDIKIEESYRDNYNVSITTDAKAKAGRYRFNLAGQQAEFYILPAFINEADEPEIHNISFNDENDYANQLTSLPTDGSVKGVTISGENLQYLDKTTLLISDTKGVQLDIISINSNEIKANFKLKGLQPGNIFIRAVTAGGESNSWQFDVKNEGADPDELQPFQGVYSTKLTLLEVNSLSNLPFNDLEDSSDDSEDDGEGRPQNAEQTQEGQGRPQNFNLMNSDLETIWLLESVASVNDTHYKESKIIRRTVPRASAALTTNSKVSFGQDEFKITGQQTAGIVLEDSSSAGQTIFEFDNPNDRIIQNRNEEEDERYRLNDSAVVEDLGLDKNNQQQDGENKQNPNVVDFKPGSYVSVINPTDLEPVDDFAFIDSVDGNLIYLKKPAFEEAHFSRDQLVQYVPAVISTQEINEREAQQHIEPIYAWLKVADVYGMTKFSNIFYDNIAHLNYFKRDPNYKVPVKGIDVSNTTTEFSIEDQKVALSDQGKEYFGLNILYGSKEFTKEKPLRGQGVMIIDTTNNGQNESGGKVTIDGGSDLASRFDGFLYIIGEVKIVGNFEMNGNMICISPSTFSSIKISAGGSIKYDEKALQKAVFDLPFATQIGTVKMEKVKLHAL
jgi:hypothetical protein